MPPISIENPELPKRKENFALDYFAPEYEPDYKAGYPDAYSSLNYTKLNSLLDAQLKEKERAVQQLYDVYVSCPFVPERGVLVGTGEISPHNVGFRLSQPHGLPYLPGSGIQGMLRSYIIEYVFGKVEADALADNGFYKIFGGQRVVAENGKEKTDYRKGVVDFLDAYPKVIDIGTTKREIMNNHFQDYYMENLDAKKNKIQPLDSLKLNPIVYLTTSKIDFQVCVGIRHLKQNEPIKEGAFQRHTPLTVVARYLKAAFKFYGVGARTKNNFGRGTFEPTSFSERKSTPS